MHYIDSRYNYFQTGVKGCIEDCMEKSGCVGVVYMASNNGQCYGYTKIVSKTHEKNKYYDSYEMSCLTEAANSGCLVNVPHAKNHGSKVEYKYSVKVECEEGYALQ